MTPDTVIDFWLAAGESRWFTRNAVFDGELAVRFKDTLANARFGRFPHRNAILGRKSTPEELAFLANGGFAG